MMAAIGIRREAEKLSQKESGVYSAIVVFWRMSVGAYQDWIYIMYMLCFCFLCDTGRGSL